jgi:propionyl-CoA carboxylase alpha chain
MYGGEERVVELHDCDGQLWIDGRSVRVHEHGFPMRLEVQGVVRSAFVVRVGDTSYVRLDAGEYTVIHRPRFEAPGADEADGGCIASMPGKVVQVLVSEGESVEKGQAVVVLEAMKMEQTMTAPDDGVVSAVNVAVDDQVDVGAVLVVVDPIADE